MQDAESVRQPTRRELFNQVINERWRVAENDLIGGWCIVLEQDKRTPANGSWGFIDMIVTEQIAQHVVDCHHAALAVRAGFPEEGS